MKKSIIYLSFVFLFLSCSSDDGGSLGNNTNQSLIYGWWFRNPENTNNYKAYYFGEDNTFIQDMTNFMMGQGEGVWSWEEESKIKLEPTSNIAGGTQYIDILKLTQDSLVAKHNLTGAIVRYSRTNHEIAD